MADFSKQWCDINDPDMPSDFDIDEVFNKLKPNTYDNWICEGFGFAAIGNMDGNCMLAMPVDDANYGTVVWKPYDVIVK
jgi:hypothetical protein